MPVRKHRVLMVEDDLQYAESITLLLGSQFEISATHDAGSGLESIQAGSFDAVILDLDLPPALAGGGSEEGFTLATRVRQIYGDALPIIILTREVPEHLKAALPEVVDAVLLKSSSADAIENSLLDLVRGSDCGTEGHPQTKNRQPEVDRDGP